MTARGQSIGAVLTQLKPDFPDLSISKIRFLEAEGLITPDRTRSGYRTFSSQDVERLRYILTAQRDRFWPLRVIREALDAIDRGLTPPPEGSADPHPSVPDSAPDPSLPTAAQLRPSSLRLTAAELRRSTELDGPTLEALTTFGLLRPDADGHYNEGDLAVARAAGALAAYGVEPRHLRPFRTAADREIGLVQQMLSPVRGRVARGHDAQRAGDESDPTAEVLAWCVALHAGLVRSGLGSG